MASAQATVQRQLDLAAARLPDLFAPGARLVVGYSGGQDSTCLVHALSHARPPLDLVAAHVDHGLRPGSVDDARAVASLGESMGVRVDVCHLDVGAYRHEVHGWSVQQAARAARYQALASLAGKHTAAAVLTAHTADDQAETLLLNLIRGSGLDGLAGMRVDETLDTQRLGPPIDGLLQPLAVALTRFRLVRPLLRVSRVTTRAYCAELGLSMVEDASNSSRVYARNRVRLDLLPALERFNPAIRAVLARTADLAAEDVAALDAIVEQLFARLTRAPEPNVLEYDLRLWHAQPRALQRRLLRLGLAALLGGLTDVHAGPIDDALDMLRSGRLGQTYHLPYGVELYCAPPSSFRLRLHGRARARARQNTGIAEVSRV